MKDQEVIIYSTNWCGYCKQAKKYFNDKGVKFTEKNIEEDEAANKELMVKIKGQFRGVPVIDINGQIIDGFDRAAINAALGQKPQL